MVLLAVRAVISAPSSQSSSPPLLWPARARGPTCTQFEQGAATAAVVAAAGAPSPPSMATSTPTVLRGCHAAGVGIGLPTPLPPLRGHRRRWALRRRRHTGASRRRHRLARQRRLRGASVSPQRRRRSTYWNRSWGIIGCCGWREGTSVASLAATEMVTVANVAAAAVTRPVLTH